MVRMPQFCSLADPIYLMGSLLPFAYRQYIFGLPCPTYPINRILSIGLHRRCRCLLPPYAIRPDPPAIQSTIQLKDVRIEAAKSANEVKTRSNAVNHPGSQEKIRRRQTSWIDNDREDEWNGQTLQGQMTLKMTH